MIIANEQLLGITKHARAAVYIAAKIPDTDRGSLGVAKINSVGLVEIVIEPQGIARLVLCHLAVMTAFLTKPLSRK